MAVTDNEEVWHKWTYRLISSLHSNVVLLDKGRKLVVLSVEGWSKVRTQHSSPNRTHWPADAQRCNTLWAGGIQFGTNRLTRRKNLRPLLKVTLSCRSRSRLTRMLCVTDLDPTARWSMWAWVTTHWILSCGPTATSSQSRNKRVLWLFLERC